MAMWLKKSVFIYLLFKVLIARIASSYFHQDNTYIRKHENIGLYARKHWTLYYIQY